MMNKVAIVTIISRNYGNRLQNYALQVALEKMGLQTETLPTNLRYTTSYYIKLFAKTCLNFFNHKYEIIHWDWFDLKIHWAKVTDKEENIAEIYDYFVAGSDQIWNPMFGFNSAREFLPFANPEQRIAYAASIGLDNLPTEFQNSYREALSKFRCISVREYAGAKIIKELIGIDVPVVIDPTMLLSGAEWIKAVNKFKISLNNKYIIKYFLGIRDKNYDQFICNYAVSNNFLVIDITHPPLSLKGKIGPGEFVNLIANSQMVFTDSFHGTIFSIIFQRPFIVFSRPYELGYGEMNSRLDTVLKIFNFENRRVKNIDDMRTVDFDCDFQNTENILNCKKSEAITFLKKAFDMEAHNENRTHKKCES